MGWYYDLELPCKLSDALPKLSKEQLIELGRGTQMKFSTSLRKSELLTKIQAELPARIEYVFDTFDESRASLMRLVLSRRGALPLREVALSDGDLACLGGQGVFVVGRHDKERCLGVPLELLERFRQHDGLPYAERVAANTRWITAVQGFIYHYGVISTYQTYTYLSLLFGKEVSFSTQPSFWGVLSAMQGYRGAFNVDGAYFSDPTLDSAAQVLDRRPAGLGYKLFNLEDLYAAADPLYIDPTEEGDVLYDYLLQQYDLPEDKARRLIYVGRRVAMREGNVAAALSAYAVVCGADVAEHDPELVRLVVDYLNNTSHWSLCGHAMVALVPDPREETTGKLVDFSEYKNRSK